MSDGLVKWKSAYEIGDPEIDGQHRHLVEVINDLHASQLNPRLGVVERNEQFRSAVHDAVAYIKEHFASEQAFMEETGYPDLHSQEAMHADFVRHVVAEAQRFDAGDNHVPNRFVRFLRDWYMEHVVIEDQKIGIFLREREALNDSRGAA